MYLNIEMQEYFSRRLQFLHCDMLSNVILLGTFLFNLLNIVNSKILDIVIPEDG